jgi:Sugar (and other) transporter
MTGVPLKRRVLVAIIIGNVLEWYDFAIYGYFVSSIAKLFFPNTDHVASLLAAFGVFALGFVGRVGGSLLYGVISDRKGRGYALRASVILMAVATTAIGCLPTYQTIGRLAPILLIGLRLGQGLSLGGEFADMERQFGVRRACDTFCSSKRCWRLTFRAAICTGGTRHGVLDKLECCCHSFRRPCSCHRRHCGGANRATQLVRHAFISCGLGIYMGLDER